MAFVNSFTTFLVVAPSFKELTFDWLDKNLSSYSLLYSIIHFCSIH